MESSDTVAPDACSDSWVVVESAEDVIEAARNVTNRMIDFLMKHFGVQEVTAYVLCSVALKLRLSQVVNEPVYTVSGAISKQILPEMELFASK